MFLHQQDAFEAWVKPGQEIFDFWISFFPTAPVFGVDWRFADMVGVKSGDDFDQMATPVAVARVQPEAALPETAPADIAKLSETARTAEVATPAGLLTGAPADTDDLTAIKGIGAGTAKKLNALGIWQYRQLAEMSDADLAWLDANIGGIKGACFRGDWAGQARALTA